VTDRLSDEDAPGIAEQNRGGRAAAEDDVPRASVDLDLRGRALVRLVDADPAGLRAVRRQLGPLPQSAVDDARQPDVTIRFVDRLEVDGPVRRLGADAMTIGDAYVVTRGRRKADVRVRIPIETVGLEPAVIEAERGGTSIPLLLPVLAASLLTRGIAPLHASAFRYDGRGVLVTGWAKGGKSETLLAFLLHGAAYVGDEWVFVDPDGPQMFGILEPIRLWDWQLAMVPALARRVGASSRARLALATGAARALRVTGRLPVVGASPAGEAARRAGSLVDRQRSIQIPIADLVDAVHVVDAAVPLDRVVLVVAGAADAVRTGLPASEAADRIAATTTHELGDLVAAALAYRHAAPGRPHAGLDDLRARLTVATAHVLATVPILEAEHRFPPDIPGLFDLIAPHL
jgi:hypothetical protein